MNGTMNSCEGLVLPKIPDLSSKFRKHPEVLEQYTLRTDKNDKILNAYNILLGINEEEYLPQEEEYLRQPALRYNIMFQIIPNNVQKVLHYTTIPNLFLCGGGGTIDGVWCTR